MICFKRIKHSLAVIRENPIPRLALHCVIGPGSYNNFIFLYFSIALFVLCTGILGRKPVSCYTAWSFDLPNLKIKINNCFSSHTSHMTDLEFIVLT